MNSEVKTWALQSQAADKLHEEVLKLLDELNIQHVQDTVILEYIPPLLGEKVP